MNKRWGDKLSRWYMKNKRDLPWRKNQDPYKILVSEIMLQQTQVIKVIPYFERFIRTFPDFESLSQALEDDVLKLWSGLGYYRRARNLKKTSQVIVDTYNGSMPKCYEDIVKLPGIGDYTANAILSIAFDQSAIVLDGNVIRVSSRVFGIGRDLDKTCTKDKIKNQLKAEMFDEKPSVFNQALMELGALICTPSSPHCTSCPVSQHCYALQNHLVEELPPVKKQQEIEVQHKTAFIIKHQGKWLVTKKTNSKILNDLWIFPEVHQEKNETFEKSYGLKIKLGKKIADITHHITYRRMRYEIREAFLKKTMLSLRGQQGRGNLNLKWVSSQDLNEIPHSSLTAKIMDKVQDL